MCIVSHLLTVPRPNRCFYCQLEKRKQSYEAEKAGRDLGGKTKHMVRPEGSMSAGLPLLRCLTWCYATCNNRHAWVQHGVGASLCQDTDRLVLEFVGALRVTESYLQHPPPVLLPGSILFCCPGAVSTCLRPCVSVSFFDHLLC